MKKSSDCRDMDITKFVQHHWNESPYFVWYHHEAAELCRVLLSYGKFSGKCFLMLRQNSVILVPEAVGPLSSHCIWEIDPKTKCTQLPKVAEPEWNSVGETSSANQKTDDEGDVPMKSEKKQDEEKLQTITELKQDWYYLCDDGWSDDISIDLLSVNRFLREIPAKSPVAFVLTRESYHCETSQNHKVLRLWTKRPTTKEVISVFFPLLEWIPEHLTQKQRVNFASWSSHKYSTPEELLVSTNVRNPVLANAYNRVQWFSLTKQTMKKAFKSKFVEHTVAVPTTHVHFEYYENFVDIVSDNEELKFKPSQDFLRIHYGKEDDVNYCHSYQHHLRRHEDGSVKSLSPDELAQEEMKRIETGYYPIRSLQMSLVHCLLNVPITVYYDPCMTKAPLVILYKSDRVHLFFHVEESSKKFYKGTSGTSSPPATKKRKSEVHLVDQTDLVRSMTDPVKFPAPPPPKSIREED